MQPITIALILVAAVCISAWEHGHHHNEEHYAPISHEHHEEHYVDTPYKYEYGVKDAHTHDHKDAWEHSDGHHVQGGYKFDEADGTHRVVEYHSDEHGGTNTIVKRVGHAVHPEHHGHGHATSYANYNQFSHEQSHVGYEY